jgi:hypothetical protein
MSAAGISAAGAAAGNAAAEKSELSVGWVLQLMSTSSPKIAGGVTEVEDEFSSALLNPALAGPVKALEFRTDAGMTTFRAMLKPHMADQMLEKLTKFSDGLGYFDLFPLAKGNCYEFHWKRYQDLLDICRWTTPEEAAKKRRVLCNACTGSGKSGLIAMAPFAGAHHLQNYRRVASFAGMQQSSNSMSEGKSPDSCCTI